jgi:3-hydroxybutyryl-CoA dehydrogenase
MRDVRIVGVVGAGIMGGGIAQCLAVAGYSVIVCDLNEEILRAARQAIISGKFGLERAIAIGKIPGDQLRPTIDRLSFQTHLAVLSTTDFIIEAIPEDLAAKRTMFGSLDRLVDDTVVLASNTSGFSIAELGQDLPAERKSRFVGMHFASPVPVMKMCEVVYTPDTSTETVDEVRNLANSLGKVVSMVKDVPGTYGFILNRVFAAARREADQIVADGIATPEDIDRAMMGGRNWPVGFYGTDGARTGWVDVN